MGCVKSKHERADTADGMAKVAGKRRTGEKMTLMASGAGLDDSPVINPALLEYAQRLSEDIVARAVQQWAELDSRYSDIPYIECDVP